MNIFKVESRNTFPTVGLLLIQSLFFVSSIFAAEAPVSDGSAESINARADYFRVDNNYEPPPGEALHHYTSGFAKILCSAVFVT